MVDDVTFFADGETVAVEQLLSDLTPGDPNIGSNDGCRVRRTSYGRPDAARAGS